MDFIYFIDWTDFYRWDATNNSFSVMSRNIKVSLAYSKARDRSGQHGFDPHHHGLSLNKVLQSYLKTILPFYENLEGHAKHIKIPY